MAASNALPVFSDTVNQQFFIEALTGARQPVSYLDRFPNAVYNKSIDSVLVTLAYGLLGPVGVGLLRQEYLQARLQIEEAGLQGADLDALYTSPFAFARLAEETYDLDASASLLPLTQRAQIMAQDATFRNRAVSFLKGIRAGGTPLGLSLVAASGLNQPVDIVENYKALYDQYSDIPMNLSFMGTTTNLNEIIILPRQMIPQNGQQSIVINGEPQSGWFTLSIPLGPNYQQIQAGVTSGSSTVTVPNAYALSPGTFLTFRNGGSYLYAQVGPVLSPTSIQALYPSFVINTGQPYNLPWSTNTYTSYVGNAQTVPLPYDATYGQIQSALWTLPVIGNNNVQVSGGPLPDQPIIITFVNTLGDINVPAIAMNTVADIIAGVSSVMVDINNNPLTITPDVVVDQAGVSVDGQTAAIAPANFHAMQIAIDNIRPVTSFITTQSAQAVTRRQPANSIYAGQTYTEVLRYETGNGHVNWPTSDSIHWIENVEHEAPRAVGDLQHHYQGFHNVLSTYAYTEAALQDANYSIPTAGSTPIWQTYWNTHVGQYSPAQQALYPFLSNYTNPLYQFEPTQAIAASPDPLIITSSVNGTGILNNLYPTDYLGLPGIPQLSTTNGFWSSQERLPAINNTPTVDYLELDLGSVQAVNYLYFEATNKPYSISVAYDALDQSPGRSFIPVTLMPSAIARSTTNLIYNASVSNPWTMIAFHFTNALNEMIFTRYLRIGFTRTPAGSPFASTQVPYSIEVRNLRIGRNLASNMDRNVIAPKGIDSHHLYPSVSLLPSDQLLPH